MTAYIRNDKSYPYVKVTLGEDFPRILRTRQLGDRTARYFGPYANAKSVDQTLDLLQKLYPYRNCKLTIVAELSDLERLVRREPAVADRKVVVHSFPLSARDVLLSIARTNRSSSAEEATSILQALPFVLAEGLTRGGAAEMVALVTREKVDASAE